MSDEGGVVRLKGVVRLAHAQPLLSPLGKKPAVCWELREGLHDRPKQSDAQDFWLETDSGEVLVVAGHFFLAARAERQVQMLAVVETEIDAVSRRLREIKEEKRRAEGRGASALNREQKQLAKVATLLCAIRAQARGKVHLSGTLSSQENWISKNAHLAKGGFGGASAQMAVERWEVVIGEGQRVEVEGRCLTEPVPPGLASSDGYRSRSTSRVLRGTEAIPLRVTGTGASAASLTEAPTQRRTAPLDRVTQRKSTYWIIGVVIAFTAILVWALSR